MTLPVEHTHTEVRRSTRDRKQRQFLTYESLGEPSIQSHIAVNSVSEHTPHTSVVNAPHPTPAVHPLMPYISPVYIPYSKPIFCTTPYIPPPCVTPITSPTYVPPTMLVC